MNILIKGMAMPKDCSECILANKHIDGLCKAKYYCRLEADFKHCPLIEIPTPHGRLIDADALSAKYRRMADFEENRRASPISWAYAFEDTIDVIDDAPTILEAEGGDAI